MKFKFLEHTADIKFQAFGNSLEEVFENSALAMFNAMHDGKVEKETSKKIQVKGKDNESLMYNFLEELLFLFDSEGFFLSEVKSLKIEKEKLVAEVVGDKAENYEIHIDVKAVTYNEMFVREEKKGKWVGQVVLDV
ncbi:MAG: archease [archaeon]